MPDMNATERAINADAEFLPMAGEGTLPCLVVGGVQVYAYFEGGQLCVSLNYETPDPFVMDGDGAVPTRVTVGDTEIYVAP